MFGKEEEKKKKLNAVDVVQCLETILCHQRFVIELYYLHIISVEWVILVQLTIKRKRVFSCSKYSQFLFILFCLILLPREREREICILFSRFFCNLTDVSAEQKLTVQNRRKKAQKFRFYMQIRIIKRQIKSMESISFPLELLVEYASRLERNFIVLFEQETFKIHL